VGGIALTRIVSVGSLAAVTLTVIGYVMLAALGLLPFDGARFAFLAGTAVMVFARHSANIRRLAAGREPRLGAKNAER
jgi:glycerol-3-phosphate acyltransferase PlsY